MGIVNNYDNDSSGTTEMGFQLFRDSEKKIKKNSAEIHYRDSAFAPWGLTKPEELLVLKTYQKYVFKNCNRKTPSIVKGIPLALSVYREAYDDLLAPFKLIDDIKNFDFYRTGNTWFKSHHPAILSPKIFFSRGFLEYYLGIAGVGADAFGKSLEFLVKYEPSSLLSVINKSGEDVKKALGNNQVNISKKELLSLFGVGLKNKNCNYEFIKRTNEYRMFKADIPLFISHELIKKFSSKHNLEWLYLFGEHGVGKTLCSIIIGLNALAHGLTIYFVDARCSDSFKKVIQKREQIKIMEDVDLLIIDGIRPYRFFDYPEGIFREIINERELNDRCTIFTSNHLISEFNEHNFLVTEDNDRSCIQSRICGKSLIMFCY